MGEWLDKQISMLKAEQAKIRQRKQRFIDSGNRSLETARRRFQAPAGPQPPAGMRKTFYFALWAAGEPSKGPPAPTAAERGPALSGSDRDAVIGGCVKLGMKRKEVEAIVARIGQLPADPGMAVALILRNR